MITKISNGKIVLGNNICKKNLYFCNGKITSVTNDDLSFDIEIDAKGNYVSAGFIDIHVHGGAGYEFVDATKEAIVKASNLHCKHGTTTIFPTLSSYSYEQMTNCLDAIVSFKDCEELMPTIGGVHMEGPYFSPKQCGAQDTNQIRNPQKEEYNSLIKKYGSLIRRWSYAPETDRDLSFVKTLVANNIVPSAGHTDAEYDDMKRAYENGCRLITHLYSSTSTITRHNGFRHLGVIETAYLYDDIIAETIGDGKHLPPELLKMIFKIKGRDSMCLVTDAIRYGGLTAEDVATGDFKKEKYTVEDGIAKLPDRTGFAGSIATTNVLVRTCTKDTGIPLCDTIHMVTEVPAKIMGLTSKGQIKENYDADIVIFDDNINIKTVVVGGKVYSL